MSEEQNKFWKNVGHILLTALASVLIAILQAWLAKYGHNPLPQANPVISGTVSMALSAFNRVKFS